MPTLQGYPSLADKEKVTSRAVASVEVPPSEAEVPQDLRAYFGHPLMSAAGCPGEEGRAGLALLHEYQNLGGIDRAEKYGERTEKYGDRTEKYGERTEKYVDKEEREKYTGLMDIVRHEPSEQLGAMSTSSELSMILQDSEMDAFLSENRDHSAHQYGKQTLPVVDTPSSTLLPVTGHSKPSTAQSVNKKDAFLMGNSLKEDISSPLPQFIKDEPNLSPESELGLCGTLPYGTFDFNNLPDDRTLMEEFDRSFNGTDAFHPSDVIMDTEAMDINRDLLQGFANAPNKEGLMDSYLMPSSDGGQNPTKDTHESNCGLPILSSQDIPLTHQTNPAKKPCAVHGPFVQTSVSSLINCSTVCGTPQPSSSPNHVIPNMTRPPPEYKPPLNGPYTQTPPPPPPPPPYKSPPGKPSLDELPKLMPIQYIMPPRCGETTKNSNQSPFSPKPTSDNNPLNTLFDGINTSFTKDTVNQQTIINPPVTFTNSPATTVSSASVVVKSTPANATNITSRPTSLPVTSVSIAQSSLPSPAASSLTSSACTTTVSQPQNVPAPIGPIPRMPHVVSIPPGFPIPPGAQVIFPPGLRPPFPLPTLPNPLPLPVAKTPDSSTPTTPVPAVPVPGPGNMFLYPPFGPGLPAQFIRPQVAVVRSPIPSQSTTPVCASQGSANCADLKTVNAHIKSTHATQIVPTSAKQSQPGTNAEGVLDKPHAARPHGHHCAVHGYVPAKQAAAKDSKTTPDGSQQNTNTGQTSQPTAPKVSDGKAFPIAQLPPHSMQIPIPPGATLVPVPAPPGVQSAPNTHYVIPIRMPAMTQAQGVQGLNNAHKMAESQYLVPFPPTLRPPFPPGVSYIPMPIAQAKPGTSMTLPVIQPPVTSDAKAVSYSAAMVRPSSTPVHVLDDKGNTVTTVAQTQCQSAPTTPSNPSAHYPSLQKTPSLQDGSPAILKVNTEKTDQTSKASDSTRRIINALNAKIEQSEDHKQISGTDINDIINLSMCAAGITPDTNNNGNEEVTEEGIDVKLSDNNEDSMKFKPKQLFAPATNSPLEAKPFFVSPMLEQINSTVTSRPMLTQIVHPTPATPMDTSNSSSPISIRQLSHLHSPLRTTSTHILHKPSAVVHPAASPSFLPVKKSEKDLGPPLVIAPQAPNMVAAPGLPLNADLRSPDSGFNETCVSPADVCMAGYGDIHSSRSSSPKDGSMEKPGKRRRSSSSHKAICTTPSFPNKHYTQSTVIEKLDPESCCFHYVLETNISTSQRIDEDRITYLNKGQFYGVKLEHVPRKLIPAPKSMFMKSVISVLFRDEKCVADELRAWEFWHTRQHSFKQRILDIDTKNSSGVVPGSIEEVSHNAVSLRWTPTEQPAKVSIAIHCLSTDFSNQKGVKGLPLHVQIDTYEDGDEERPFHRGFSQVKVFCDKGAERKARDEERRKDAKSKMAEANGRRRVEEVFHQSCEITEFYHAANLDKPAVFFTPSADGDDYARRIPISPVDAPVLFKSTSLGCDTKPDVCSPVKRMRTASYPYESQKVLLYVREPHESAFTALLLHSPTLTSLTAAIEDKYKIEASHISNIYKRSKRGILVKMDDNILAHYSNETTFIIDLQTEDLKGSSLVEITLTEIDANSK